MFYQVNNKVLATLIAITLFLYYLTPFKLLAFPASFHVFTLLASFFVLLIVSRFSFRTNKEDKLFYLFVALFIVSTMLASNPPKLNTFFSWMTSLIIFWTLSHSSSHIKYKWFNLFTCTMLFIWAAFSIAQALLGETAYFPGWFGLPRPSIYSSGLTLYSNYAAIIMLPLLISVFVQIIFKREKYKISLWFLGVMALYFMMSRAAWLGLFVSIVVIAFGFRRDKQKIFMIVKLIVIMILAVSFSTLLPTKLDYIESSHIPNKVELGDIESSDMLNQAGSKITHITRPVDYSANTRIVTLKVALKAIAQHPITGLGLGYFPEFYKSNYINYVQKLEIDPRKLMTPHNGYIQLLTENGSFTFIALVLLIFFILKHAYVSQHPESIAIFASTLAVLIWLLFHDGLGERILWILLGLSSSIINIQERG